MTATGSPRPEGSDLTAELGSFVGEPLTTRPPGLFLLSFFLLLTTLFTNTEPNVKQKQQTKGYLQMTGISSL